MIGNIEKPKQYYDTRRHQLYYQWPESEYFSHQEPIYDRTRDYIEALEAENAKMGEMVRSVLVLRHDPVYKWLDATFAEVFGKSFTEQARELGMEMDE